VLNEQEAGAVKEFERRGGQVVTGDHATWLAEVRAAIGTPSIELTGPPTVRVVVRDQPERTIIHVYNLNVARLSSFEDKVTPAENVKLAVTVPFAKIGSVISHTADSKTTSGDLAHEVKPASGGSRVEFSLRHLEISAIITVEQAD
jgi:hypothetical protein